jgi:hypothetical protein
MGLKAQKIEEPPNDLARQHMPLQHPALSHHTFPRQLIKSQLTGPEMKVFGFSVIQCDKETIKLYLY